MVGHGPDIDREGGAANILRSLGADVRTLDLWDACYIAMKADRRLAAAIGR